MSGWIRVHRRIIDHWIYKDKPFDRRSAWIDLVFLANFRDCKLSINNQVISVKRGSFITSEYKLSDRWGWPRKNVRTFLGLLEEDKMISKIATTKYTHISIFNYELYQFDGINVAAVRVTTEGTSTRIDIKDFEPCMGTTDGTSEVLAFEAHQGTTNGTSTRIDIKDFEPYMGTTNGTSGDICLGTQKKEVTYIDTLSKLNNKDNGNKSSSSVKKIPTVTYGEEKRDRETLERIKKVSCVNNFTEKKAMFIDQILDKLWYGKIQDDFLNHQQIRDRLRMCRVNHFDMALSKMEGCKTNKEIYFAKALISAITESGIEEIFTYEGGED